MHVLSTCQLESGKCTVEFDDAGMRETNKNTIVNISFSEKIVGAALDGGLNASSLSLPPPLVKKKIGPTVTPKPTTELALDLQVLTSQTRFSDKNCQFTTGSHDSSRPQQEQEEDQATEEELRVRMRIFQGTRGIKIIEKGIQFVNFCCINHLARIPVPNSGRERRQIACQVRKFTVGIFHVSYFIYSLNREMKLFANGFV